MKTPEKVGPKSVVDLYPDVCQWLEDFLKDRFRQAEVDVHALRIPQFPVFSALMTEAAFLENGSHGILKLILLDLYITPINQPIWL